MFLKLSFPSCPSSWQISMITPPFQQTQLMILFLRPQISGILDSLYVCVCVSVCMLIYCGGACAGLHRSQPMCSCQKITCRKKALLFYIWILEIVLRLSGKHSTSSHLSPRADTELTSEWIKILSLPVGLGMAQWGKCSVRKHETLSLSPWNPQNSRCGNSSALPQENLSTHPAWHMQRKPRAVSKKVKG